MNTPIDICLICREYTDCYFNDIKKYCHWKCKKQYFLILREKKKKTSYN